jgi:hypothetical protein
MDRPSSPQAVAVRPELELLLVPTERTRLRILHAGYRAVDPDFPLPVVKVVDERGLAVVPHPLLEQRKVQMPPALLLERNHGC